MIKTVLAPGAPWPKQVEPVKPVEQAKAVPKPKPKAQPKRKKKLSKIARTNLKFIEWAGKNLESAL